MAGELILIVEDNENGIKAAQASGAHVLVVRDVNEVNLDNILRRVREVAPAQPLGAAGVVAAEGVTP